jgi:hypothetical protein
MLEAMETTCNENMEVLKQLKPGKEHDDWEGTTFGLNEVRLKIADFVDKTETKNDCYDDKPFLQMDGELIKRVNKKGDTHFEDKSPSYKSGYLYGLEQGRGYIDALYDTELKNIHQQQRKEIDMSNNNFDMSNNNSASIGKLELKNALGENSIDRQLETAKKAGYVQGVCECVAALGNDHALGKKLLTEMNVNKDMAKKFANPETFKALEQGIFAQKQEHKLEQAQGVKR